MAGDRAREVVIEVPATYPGLQHAHQVTAIRFERNVKYRNFIAGAWLHASEQLDITFDTGDELSVARIGKSQLMQSADAVGITVEDVIESQSELPMAAVSFYCARRTPHK